MRITPRVCTSVLSLLYYLYILFVQGSYGIDWEGPTHSQEREQVEIPTTSSPLTVQQTAELTRAINPMEPCQDLGVELYLATMAFVNACI